MQYRNDKKLSEPVIELKWSAEPNLLFAEHNQHINPKIGIPLFGPKSLNTSRHTNEVHIGFVGEPFAVENVQKFLEECKKGIIADDVENGSLPFPAISKEQGFRFDFKCSDEIYEKITTSEKNKILEEEDSKAQFEHLINLIEEKVSIICEKDHPLDYLFIVLTEDVYEKYRVIDTPDPIRGKGKIQRNFRRVLKARLMKFGKPTQLIRESSTGFIDVNRNMQDKATRAWNLFTAMYYKVGGLPWGPVGLKPSTCFVGISFFRPFGEPNHIRASIAQAFDENGDGLVLRGQKFKWEEEFDKSPHMPKKLANQLVKEVLKRYEIECKASPRRVVIHKTSRFEPDEKNGFENALKNVTEHDLVTVGTTNNFRLFREGAMPPLRGTVMNIGDNYFLYSTGYIPEIGKYPHGHVPSPLRIVDHFGDTHKDQLIKELFVLTKMNWNTANMEGSYPITLQFARLVGEILREFPEKEIPNPKYTYYM